MIVRMGQALAKASVKIDSVMADNFLSRITKLFFIFFGAITIASISSSF
jgi:preprotein translocase subunit SecG